MKRCPICNAGAFDDAAVCYGCLHRFQETQSGESLINGFEGTVRAAHAADSVPMQACPGEGDSSSVANDDPPTLVIAVQAVPSENGVVEWRCDVDGRTQHMSLS